MKKYIKPTLRTLDLNSEHLMAGSYKVSDKSTDGEALSNHMNGWNCNQWMKSDSEE